ncbi:hypothetical protein BH09SUM1_BH09SUM1_20040 [soil metagenome]
MKHLLPLLAIPALALATGCAGLSMQSYGSTTRGHHATESATRADILANLGEPDSIIKSDDTEAYIYKGVTGASYFGIFSTIERKDQVAVMDKTGRVMTVVEVDEGKGWTVFAPLGLDATHPAHTTELLAGPENYEYKYQAPEGK